MRTSTPTRRQLSRIDTIAIHCSATPNGSWRGVDDIDAIHAAKGFARDPALIGYNQPHLKHIGYHYVVYVAGAVTIGRGIEEIGAHVKGHNFASIGVCMIGTDAYTRAQWKALRANVCVTIALLARARGVADVPRFSLETTEALRLAKRMSLRICGHRDLSPDIDGDGTVEPHEWLKTCPGFDVGAWLAGGMGPLAGHIIDPVPGDFPEVA